MCTVKQNHPDVQPVTCSYYHQVITQNLILDSIHQSDSCNFCDKAKFEIAALNPETDADMIRDLNRDRITHLICTKAVQKILKKQQ